MVVKAIACFQNGLHNISKGYSTGDDSYWESFHHDSTNECRWTSLYLQLFEFPVHVQVQVGIHGQEVIGQQPEPEAGGGVTLGV